MGCDIHCYIEYREKDRSEWNDFGGRINPGRNYWMFTAMAGVRGDDIPHIEPRGRLKDMASSARYDDYIFVSEQQTEPFVHESGETYFSPDYAEECVSKGYCEWTDERKCFVTNSDHHTHSWLSADEFELALACYLKKAGFQVTAKKLGMSASDCVTLTTAATSDQEYALSAITEYWAILAAMRCFEAQGHEARLVMWFDN